MTLRIFVFLFPLLVAAQEEAPSSGSGAIEVPDKSEGEAAEAEKPFLKEVTVAEAKALLAKRNAPVILDIRTPSEFEKGHIKNAINLNVYDPKFLEKLGELDPTKTYLVHCASGGRSTQVLPEFKKLEFLRLYHLTEGFQGWERAE